MLGKGKIAPPPFITMVMLLGPGENGVNQSSCTVDLHGACVHMVVRGLSSCSKFLSQKVQGYLNQSFELNNYESVYGFSKSDAKFVVKGMKNMDF